MYRRQFLATVGMTAAGVSCAYAKNASRPNILIIFSDDQGYADLSCYDHAKEVNTPNIDQLAKDGVRLTDGHVTAPVCGPSRAGLLTGRYQQRFGYYYNSDSGTVALKTEITVAEMLKDAGYVTGVIGKWQLGKDPEDLPNSQGFDEFYGFLSGGHDYFNTEQEGNPLYRNKKVVKGEKGYLTDIFTREADSFIRKHAKGNKPFFLYLPYNAVHKPHQAKEEYLKLFDTGVPERDNYLARLASLDEGVGVILKALKDTGVYDNTLVFYLSDNGGGKGNTGGDNGVLRGGKCTFYEGGTRVPFLVSWPARLPAGTVCDTTCVSFDIMPTAAAVAGGKMPSDRVCDGRNMLALLEGTSKEPLHEIIFWQTRGEDWSVRRGDWKMIHVAKSREADGHFELYNLKDDIGETKNLADKHPDVVEKLKKLHDEWKSQMI